MGSWQGFHEQFQFLQLLQFQSVHIIPLLRRMKWGLWKRKKINQTSQLLWLYFLKLWSIERKPSILTGICLRFFNIICSCHTIPFDYSKWVFVILNGIKKKNQTQFLQGGREENLHFALGWIIDLVYTPHFVYRKAVQNDLCGCEITVISIRF